MNNNFKCINNHNCNQGVLKIKITVLHLKNQEHIGLLRYRKASKHKHPQWIQQCKNNFITRTKHDGMIQ